LRPFMAHAVNESRGTPTLLEERVVLDLADGPLRTRSSQSAASEVTPSSRSVHVAAADCHLTAPPAGSDATRTSTAPQHAWRVRSSAEHIDSRMSRCVWFGGQDWVGPHRLVGRLVLGHTEPKVGVGGNRQVIMRTAPRWVRQPDIGSGSHPDLMCRGGCVCMFRVRRSV
jgi:hypothetical protein